MATNTELLNTVLADLKGPAEHTLVQRTPTWDMLKKRGKMSSDKGQLLERVIFGGSPAQGKGIYTGTEIIPGGRTERTYKIQLQTHRAVVRIDLPKKQLLEASGKTAVIKLADEYVRAITDLLPLDMERFFLTGVSHGHVLATSEMEGWNTLNGQKVFAQGVVGVTNGLLDMAAYTSQADTVQNLAKSSSYGYANQYGEITSYAVDGRRTYDRQAREVGAFNLTSADGRPDVGVVDFDSFALLEEDSRDHVRIVSSSADVDKGSKAFELVRNGIRYQAAKNLILTDFTGAAAEGVCYFLTLDGIEWVWFQQPSMSDFSEHIYNQDVVSAKMEFQGALLMRNMRAQGVVVGGARP